jgi:aminoglycoside 3-N-acetyltransferase
MSRQADYTVDSLAAAMRKVGLRRGDRVFTHSNIGFLGYPDIGWDAESMCRAVSLAFRSVIGPEGTLVVPTFTYSWCRGEDFDPLVSPSTCGLFSEWFRRQPGIVRSQDPIFSVAAEGQDAVPLCSDYDGECFGEDSIWRRLIDTDALILNINLDAGSTFLHYLERRAHVRYRYNKLFAGRRRVSGEWITGLAHYFCSDGNNPATIAYFTAFHDNAIRTKTASIATVGRGSLLGIRARSAKILLGNLLRTQPWILTRSHRQGELPVLTHCSHALSGEPVAPITAELRPDPCGPDADAFLKSFVGPHGAIEYRYPTGHYAAGLPLPERWELETARVSCPETNTDLIPTAVVRRGVVPYSRSCDEPVTVGQDSRIGTNVWEDDPRYPGSYLQLRRTWALQLPEDLLRELHGRSIQVQIKTRLIPSFHDVSVLTPEILKNSPTEGFSVIPNWPPEYSGSSSILLRIYSSFLRTGEQARWRLILAQNPLARRAWIEDTSSEKGSHLLILGPQESTVALPPIDHPRIFNVACNADDLETLLSDHLNLMKWKL